MGQVKHCWVLFPIRVMAMGGVYIFPSILQTMGEIRIRIPIVQTRKMRPRAVQSPSQITWAELIPDW